MAVFHQATMAHQEASVFRRSPPMKAKGRMMKSLICALTLAALAGSTVAASAETTSTDVSIVSNAASSPSLYPAFKYAFSEVAPLTIQQENAVAEAALEGQGAPLHTN